MERKRLAEQKFRPLKKAMQLTFTRIKRAAQTDTLPEQWIVNEFVEQANIMVSYPGFGDAAYPRLQTACEQLASSRATKDILRFKEAVAAIIALQAACHASRNPS